MYFFYVYNSDGKDESVQVANLNANVKKKATMMMIIALDQTSGWKPAFVIQIRLILVIQFPKWLHKN